MPRRIAYDERMGWEPYSPPMSVKKAVKKAERQEITQMGNKSFTTSTRNGRIAIVTTWIMSVLAWAALFTVVQIAFPWTAPWLWTCFTFGLIPTAFLAWLSMGVYHWIQDGDWDWMN